MLKFRISRENFLKCGINWTLWTTGSGREKDKSDTGRVLVGGLSRRYSFLYALTASMIKSAILRLPFARAAMYSQSFCVKDRRCFCFSVSFGFLPALILAPP